MATNKKSDHADKGSVRVPLTRQNACVLYEASFFIKLIPAYKIKLPPSVKQVPLSPFPRKRAPRRLPPAGGTSRSRSRELFLIVSLVFGAAHCAMQNSRKLRTKCSCSTLYNTPPVYLGNPQKASLLWEEEQPNISYQARKTLCGLNM